MITVKQLSNVFENGLNTVLNNPEIQFKIWAEAGEHVGARREGNTITYFINGNLRTSTSANDANDLVMGVNGLSLEFAVPVQQPRTNATQTAEELAKIKDGQYPFVTYIVNAINGYFQTAKAISLTDGDGVEFSVAFQAGTVTPGNVDIASVLGNYLPIPVYIEVYFVEGGVNSKDVKVYFDGKSMPFQAVRHGRSPMTERDVYAGSLVSKSLVTSTAFAIDIDFPVTSDPATQACVNYLIGGEPNAAHFVNVKFGNLNEENYLMTLNTVQTSAQGIAIAGVSASLMEVVENVSALGVPDNYEMDKFTFQNSDATSVSFTAEADCLFYCAGETYSLSAGEGINIPLDQSDYEYSETDGVYYVYYVLLKTEEENGGE